MQHGSLEHYLMIALTAGLSVSLAWLGRKYQHSKLPRNIAVIMAAWLIFNYIGYTIYRIHAGYWEPRYDLPLQFCDWAAGTTIVALLTRNRFAAELSYFWVMTGSIFGILTPDIDVSFPDIRFIMFFIGHISLIVTSVFAVFGLRLYPRQGAVIRSFLFSQVYIVLAFFISLLVNGNYGYLIEKPAAGSPLDYLGEWPFYIINIEIIFFVLFWIAYSPFWIQNRKNQRYQKDDETKESAPLSLG